VKAYQTGLGGRHHDEWPTSLPAAGEVKRTPGGMFTLVGMCIGAVTVLGFQPHSQAVPTVASARLWILPVEIAVKLRLAVIVTATGSSPSGIWAK